MGRAILDQGPCMRLLLGGVNGDYLRDVVEGAAQHTERVDAAVAYATAADLLFDWCWEKRIPLRFWGRFDDGVPVAVPVLKAFLDRRSPAFSCRLVRNLHAKAIWWRGFGAYVGSANLTHRAWWNNLEAGFFLTEEELASTGQGAELDRLFAEVHRHSAPLTDELFRAIEARSRVLQRRQADDKADAAAFEANPHVPRWAGLGFVSRRNAASSRAAAFLKEWNATLQLIRDLAADVAKDANRPAWVRADAPPGAQADQFLHVHYYQRTFEGRQARYEQHFLKNSKDPEAAVRDAMEWWRQLKAPPTSEETTLNEWAPFVRSMLAPDRVARLGEDDLAAVFLRVHAIRDHARRVANRVVGLPDTRQYSIEEKTRALAAHVHRARTAGGPSAPQVLEHVLYGGPADRLAERLWDAVAEPRLKLDHMGVSAFGEIVGWALPDEFPPRNGRTSKALRSLGYDVEVHA